MKLTNCQVDHRVNPLGFAMTTPVFSWKVEDAAGSHQTAARIVVRCGGEIAADTGWAELDSLAQPVELALTPRTRYTWTVSVRTDAGEEAESAENWFETSKMDEPFAAKWIGCDDEAPRHPIFSKEIAPKKAVAAARLYVCGLGVYDAWYNGQRIGDEYMTPYCTNYNQWVQYQSFDVTALLQEAGTLSIHLGNGWYKGRFGYTGIMEPYYGNSWKLIAELRLTYADGTEDVIGTDDTWQVTRSALTFSNIYDGEHRDDTLPPVEAVPARLTDAPKGRLTDRVSLPVVMREVMKPVELIHTPKGEWVYDLGQNIAGTFRLKLRCPRGTKVHLLFGEIMQDGNFFNGNLRTAKAEYYYTASGEELVLEPHFTFFGYRYAMVDGVEGLLPDDFEGIALYSDLRETAKMETGHALINQLLSNILWGQKGNFLDMPTDCPQRDERMGWTGDGQVFCSTACYLMDSYAFYDKFLRDMWSEQLEKDGMVPEVIPAFMQNRAEAAWGDAATIMPWTLYQYYGDRTILAQQYESMAAWVDWVRRANGDDHGWRRYFHFGDWLALDAIQGRIGNTDVGRTDVGFIADTYYLYSIRLIKATAELLGKREDVEKYAAMEEKVLQDIRYEFFAPSGRCCMDTQTAYLLSLRHGLSPNPQRMAEDLVHDLKLNKGYLNTGFLGTSVICEELTRIGRPDLAYNLLLNEDYPGWLFSVKSGATTVWERWNSVLPDGKMSNFGDNGSMNSLNHYAYGCIAEWMYARCAGLRQAEPGFRKVAFRPYVDARMGHLSACYDSPAGRWESGWQYETDGSLTVTLTVPFGCTADVELPGADEAAYAAFGGKTVKTGTYSVTYRMAE